MSFYFQYGKTGGIDCDERPPKQREGLNGQSLSILMIDASPNSSYFQILANIVENMWEDKFEDILWALDLKLTNDNQCYFDRVKKRQFIIDVSGSE